MSGINFRISKPENKLAIGSSRLFGNPDVWDRFEWPCIEENGEKYDLTFMGQINCTEAAAFNDGSPLPEMGMLYFFYDLDTMPEAPDDKSARVIWYNGGMSGLHEMMLTDEDGNNMAFPELKIDFEEAGADKNTFCLLPGDSTPDSTGNYDSIKDWTALLQLVSFETEDVEIRFKDGGMLCFYIEHNNLSAYDFSDVRTAQIRF